MTSKKPPGRARRSPGPPKYDDVSWDKSGYAIISVDMQPEYEGAIGARKLRSWAHFLNERSAQNDIVFVWNGPELDMTDEVEYASWLLGKGVRAEVLESAVFIDKTYAFFAPCLDGGLAEDALVRLAAYMLSVDVHDSRDLTAGQWDHFVALEGPDGDAESTRDILASIGDPLYVPWMADRLRRYGLIALTGGGVTECLLEVELVLRALGKRYEIVRELTY